MGGRGVVREMEKLQGATSLTAGKHTALEKLGQPRLENDRMYAHTRVGMLVWVGCGCCCAVGLTVWVWA